MTAEHAAGSASTARVAEIHRAGKAVGGFSRRIGQELGMTSPGPPRVVWFAENIFRVT